MPLLFILTFLKNLLDMVYIVHYNKSIKSKGDREMAWYYGTYSCGHEGRTNIVGPTKDRERKAEWHFSGMCPECYKKQIEEKRAAVNKEAAEKSEEMELSTLK